MSPAVKLGYLVSAGWLDGMIGAVKWTDVSLNHEVRVTYGEWVYRTSEAKTLVSISADVYFRLERDFAKARWPYVDSQPDHNRVPPKTLFELVGRDYRAEDAKGRACFREDVKSAFQDMVRAGGISKLELEGQEPGWTKSYRVRYPHALPNQGQMDLAA